MEYKRLSVESCIDEGTDCRYHYVYGINDMYKDPMFNPIMQYEQAYSYYKYLCMQMDYKLKCKEYEKMCGESK